MLEANHSQILRTIPVLIAVTLIAFPAHAKYSGGSGTAQDPYQIATAADLIALGETRGDYDKQFIMTADIDLDPNLGGRKVFDKAVIAPASPTNAYPYVQGIPFTGVFDGNGHAISHLTIKGVGCLGLFGWLESRGEVKNVGVVAVSTSGSGWAVGRLVGYNRGSVTDCYSTGAVSGNDYVGGLVGMNYGNVTSCYGTGAVGGNSTVGGLVGMNYGNVTSCYGTSTVKGTETIGGLVGANQGSPLGSGIITNCYSTGTASGNSVVGGLVGYNQYDASINTSYSTGAVSGNSDVGGLVAYNQGGPVTHCFWDIETSGQTASDGGTGRTTGEMHMALTFLEWAICGNEGVWTIDDGNGYPRLWWENASGTPIAEQLSDFLAGDGTHSDPFLINTPEQLHKIGLFRCDWDKHFKLMADVDLSRLDGRDGRPAFNVIAPDTDTLKYGFQGTAFTGAFDGNGHRISHLTATGKDYLGLFGELGSAAEVRNLGVVDVNIVGSGECVGGLAASTQGAAVIQCYSTGAVSAAGQGLSVGGLVGWNDGGTMTQCYSTASVSGTSSVGGLVGQNDGALTRCYSTGAVSGKNHVGGLVGSSRGAVTQCYSTGTVSGNSYVGGLVGNNWGNIVTDYSTSTVSGTSDVGGLVGGNGGTIRNSYAAGTVAGDSSVGGLAGLNGHIRGPVSHPGVISNCYSISAVTGAASTGGLLGTNVSGPVICCSWDIQTSAQATSAGGTGMTTAEMQMAKTFLDAGWDFGGETANGTEDIWWILEGKDYPRLWWELIPEK